MNPYLYLLSLGITVILTYIGIGFYVSVRLHLGGPFSLWRGLLSFNPIDLGDSGITPEDMMDMVKDAIDDAS